MNLLPAIPPFIASLSLRLSSISPEVWRETMIALGFVITLLGIGIRWCAPRHRMSMEERLKDGLLTEKQAYRRIQQVAWAGPATIFLGLLVIVIAVLQ